MITAVGGDSTKEVMKELSGSALRGLFPLDCPHLPRLFLHFIAHLLPDQDAKTHHDACDALFQGATEMWAHLFPDLLATTTTTYSSQEGERSWVNVDPTKPSAFGITIFDKSGQKEKIANPTVLLNTNPNHYAIIHSGFPGQQIVDGFVFVNDDDNGLPPHQAGGAPVFGQLGGPVFGARAPHPDHGRILNMQPPQIIGRGFGGGMPRNAFGQGGGFFPRGAVRRVPVVALPHGNQGGFNFAADQGGFGFAAAPAGDDDAIGRFFGEAGGVPFGAQGGGLFGPAVDRNIRPVVVPNPRNAPPRGRAIIHR